jgi:hypothetical protein
MCELSVSVRCYHTWDAVFEFLATAAHRYKRLRFRYSRFGCSLVYRCLAPSVLSLISCSTRCIPATSESVYSILYSHTELSTTTKQTGEHNLTSVCTSCPRFVFKGHSFVRKHAILYDCLVFCFGLGHRIHYLILCTYYRNTCVASVNTHARN